MKIAQVNTYFVRPRWGFVEIVTDNGLTGWGEAVLEGHASAVLACGAHGYLPTEKAERGGHYSAYVSSGVTGHEGGDILVRKTVEEINKMFDRGAE